MYFYCTKNSSSSKLKFFCAKRKLLECWLNFILNTFFWNVYFSLKWGFYAWKCVEINIFCWKHRFYCTKNSSSSKLKFFCAKRKLLECWLNFILNTFFWNVYFSLKWGFYAWKCVEINIFCWKHRFYCTKNSSSSKLKFFCAKRKLLECWLNFILNTFFWNVYFSLKWGFYDWKCDLSISNLTKIVCITLDEYSKKTHRVKNIKIG